MPRLIVDCQSAHGKLLLVFPKQKLKLNVVLGLVFGDGVVAFKDFIPFPFDELTGAEKG